MRHGAVPNLFRVKFSLALKMCPVPAANCTLLWAVNRTSSSLPPPCPSRNCPSGHGGGREPVRTSLIRLRDTVSLSLIQKRHSLACFPGRQRDAKRKKETVTIMSLAGSKSPLSNSCQRRERVCDVYWYCSVPFQSRRR